MYRFKFASFQFLLRQSLLEQKHESPPKAQKKGTRNNLINVSKSVKHKDSLRISKHTHIIKPYSWNKTLKTFSYLDKKEWVKCPNYHIWTSYTRATWNKWLIKSKNKELSKFNLKEGRDINNNIRTDMKTKNYKKKIQLF